jgi:hypothetical protein
MTISIILIVAALILTVGSLVSGVISMARFDRQHSTQFMSARVGFQFATVLLVLLVLYLTQM